MNHNKKQQLCGSPGGVGRVAAEPFPLEAGSGLAGMASWVHFLLKYDFPSSAEFPPHSEVELEQKRLLSMFFNSN